MIAESCEKRPVSGFALIPVDVCEYVLASVVAGDKSADDHQQGKYCYDQRDPFDDVADAVRDIGKERIFHSREAPEYQKQGNCEDDGGVSGHTDHSLEHFIFLSDGIAERFPFLF